MNGEQRYRQATTKARILSNRNLRKFLADEIFWLPMAKDREFIISEFDRLQAEIDRLRLFLAEISAMGPADDEWDADTLEGAVELAKLALRDASALSPSHSGAGDK